MADLKISELNVKTTLVDDDLLVIVDSEAIPDTTKKIKWENIKAGKTATLVVAASNASAACISQADYVCDGVADDVQIQAAIDALTAGRTHQETVKLTGSFAIATSVYAANYTFIDATEAKLTGENAILPLRIESKSFVTVKGGIYTNSHSNYGIYIYLSTNITIEDTVVQHTTQGIYIANGGLAGPHNVTIKNNYLYSNSGDGIRITYGVKSSIIEGNISIGNTGHGIYLAGSVDANGDVSDVSVVGNIARGNGWSGIYLDTYCSRVTISGNAVDSNLSFAEIEIYGNNEATPTPTYYLTHDISVIGNAVKGGAANIHGIEVHHVSDVLIEGNTITQTTASGICSLVSKRVTILGNTVTSSGDIGIDIANSESATETSEGFSIVGNIIHLSQNSGVLIRSILKSSITGNIILDNNVAAGNGDGIRISEYSGGAGSQYIILSSNVVRGALHAYGFRIYSNADYSYVFNNDLQGNVAAMTISGTHNTIRNNQGYVTENSGTATVLNTTTTIVVNHGLATTPTRVLLTARLWSNAAKAWVTTLTTTQFTINVDADPGAGTAIFDWRAQVGEG